MIGKAEALSLCREWLARRALVRIEMFFSTHAASFFLRLTSVSDEELRFLSDDRTAEFVVRLREDYTFGYVDMRFQSQPHDGLVQSLVLLFPYSGDPKQADTIGFAEVEQPSTH